MTSVSKKIEDYYSVMPTRFNLVTRIQWTLLSDFSRRLELDLRSSKDSDTVQLNVVFIDTRNVQISAAGLVQPFLEIRDVSDRQWDGVVYGVRDTEKETMSFLCRDFSFSVEPAHE